MPRRSMADVFLSVSDDGLGLAPRTLARHGARREIDESVPEVAWPAIVRDIAKLYGGNFALRRIFLGGLEARLELPA